MLKQVGEQRWSASMRSKGTVDVSWVAARLGGGGHRAAAGFTLDGTVGQVPPRCGPRSLRTQAARLVGGRAGFIPQATVHVVSADQPLPTDAAHRRAFLAAFLRRPGTMGAVVPSSTRLSAVLASIVPTAGTPVVVELGPARAR